jgi:predicted nuclease of predicted toxin-antitoxin system
MRFLVDAQLPPALANWIAVKGSCPSSAAAGNYTSTSM